MAGGWARDGAVNEQIEASIEVVRTQGEQLELIGRSGNDVQLNHPKRQAVVSAMLKELVEIFVAEVRVVSSTLNLIHIRVETRDVGRHLGARGVLIGDRGRRILIRIEF